MKMKMKLFLCMIVFTILLFLSLFMIRAEASSRLVWIGNRTGWVTIGKDTYYIHKTNGTYHKRGEPCWDEYRWRGNKLYYFDCNGRMLRHNSKYIKLNRDDSVHYIYIAGTHHTERYNARTGYYQVKNKGGRWKSVGERSNIWWMCDWQP